MTSKDVIFLGVAGAMTITIALSFTHFVEYHGSLNDSNGLIFLGLNFLVWATLTGFLWQDIKREKEMFKTILSWIVIVPLMILLLPLFICVFLYEKMVNKEMAL